MNDMTLHVEGLRWHDPDHATRGAPVVGVPSHSYGYGVVAPPRVWGRGIRNAAHPPFRSPFQCPRGAPVEAVVRAEAPPS